MKKQLLSVCFGLCLMQFLQAQEVNFCGTAPGKTPWLQQYQRDKSKFQFPERSAQTVYIPMTVTVFTNDNGTNGYNTTNVLDEICQLNEDFAAANIYFYLASPIRSIANSLLNSHPDYGQSADIFKNNIDKTINTYYTVGAAGNCGYDFPGTGIVLAKNCMGIGSHTWAHEMGHELSLPHTFSGWEDIPYSSSLAQLPEYYVYTNKNGDTLSVIPEKVNKSNCKDTGDGFCDTAPDYLSYRWSCNAQGLSNFDLKDPNNQVFRVDGTNFLSYSNDNCMNHFSAEQMDAMRANCFSEKKDYINPTFSITKSDTTTLLFPAHNTKEASINGTILQWKKANNATHYYYEIARNTSFSNYLKREIVTDTFAVLPALAAGKDYFWRVRAFNFSYTCKPDVTPKTAKFSVEASSSVLDVNDLGNVSVFPNPVQNGEALMLKINAINAGNITLSLNDLSGRLLSQQKTSLTDGENEINFPLQNLATGMYLLQIDAPVGSIQRKVIVY